MLVKALQLASSCLSHIVPLWKHHRLNKIMVLILVLYLLLSTLLPSVFLVSFSYLSNKVSEIFLKCQQMTVV